MKQFSEQDEHRKGWYHKPHFLMDLLERGEITKAEFLLLDYLYHQWAVYRYKDDYFFRTDKEICATGILSSKSISKARNGLQDKGYIKFIKGRSHKATDYSIMPLPECYGFNACQYNDSE